MSENKKIDKDKFIMGNAAQVHKKLYLMWFWFHISFWVLLLTGIATTIGIFFSMKNNNASTWSAIWVSLIAPYAITWTAIALELCSKLFQDRIIKNYSSKNYLLRTKKEKQNEYILYVTLSLCPPLIAIIIVLIALLIIKIVYLIQRKDETQKEVEQRKKDKEKHEVQKKIAKERINAIKREVKKPDLIPASL